MFEIYERIEGRKKTYIVYFGHDIIELNRYAKRYFKSSLTRITVKAAWVIDDELYLEYPDKRKVKTCYVAYLK